MDDWNLDVTHLVSDSNCNIINQQCPTKIAQGIANTVRFKLSVGDTPRAIST